jgi:hypothetical protein
MLNTPAMLRALAGVLLGCGSDTREGRNDGAGAILTAPVR